MIDLHPQILKKDGRKEFVVLPYDEFLQLRDRLDDYEDLQQLRRAKQEEDTAPTLSIEEVKKALTPA